MLARLQEAPGIHNGLEGLNEVAPAKEVSGVLDVGLDVFADGLQVGLGELPRG